MFVNICTDNYQTSCVIRLTGTQFVLAIYQIKVDPCAVSRLYHTLGTDDGSVVFCLSKCLQSILDRCTFKDVRCLLAPTCEYIICMMMVMLMIVVMTSAGATLAMVVMMLVFFVVMIRMMLMLFVIMIMVVFVFLVVMLVMMFVFMRLVCCLCQSLHFQVVLTFDNL